MKDTLQGPSKITGVPNIYENSAVSLEDILSMQSHFAHKLYETVDRKESAH